MLRRFNFPMQTLYKQTVNIESMLLLADIIAKNITAIIYKIASEEMIIWWSVTTNILPC